VAFHCGLIQLRLAELPKRELHSDVIQFVHLLPMLLALPALQLPLAEASAKIRTGPPIDEESDYDLRVWAGELPLSFVAGEPVAGPRLVPGLEVPGYIRHARIQSTVTGIR